MFKIQACSLVTDVDCSELHVAMETVQAYLKVAKLANKGQFERYTVRKLPKFASVPELKPFLLENYSVELSPATNHSFTVEYMTHKVRQNASERLSKCKSVNSSDVSQQTTGSYRLWFVVFSRQRFFNQVYAGTNGMKICLRRKLTFALFQASSL